MHPLTLKPTRRNVVFGVLVIVLVTIVLLGRHVSRMPESRSEVDDRMDQHILAYEQWDDQHIIVFVLENPERIYIDTIHRDWLKMGIPWIPRLQWTGNWAYVDATNDPAGIGYGWGGWGTALFGQVNNPAIATIRCQMDSYVLEQSIAAPGYAVKLEDGEGPPNSCEFLDSSGDVVWTALVEKSVV